VTYRFEEEDYRHTYILEDYYHTSPFFEYSYVVVYLRDKDNLENSFAFQLNFNKTFNTLPEHPKLTEVQNEITKGFAKNAADELIVLFKQRAVEAKAYGEKNPISYLEFEPGRYFNYIELFPRNKEMLDFNYEDNQYFAEDSYDIDPRNDNKSLQLSFFKFQLDSVDQAPLFSAIYHFDEEMREKEDAKLTVKNNDMLIALNQVIPDLNDRLKQRYKNAKKMGQELLENQAPVEIQQEKAKPNEPCPCGSGKKYKKCCALMLN
jgi:hypothetical protein